MLLVKMAVTPFPKSIQVGTLAWPELIQVDVPAQAFHRNEWGRKQ